MSLSRQELEAWVVAHRAEISSYHKMQVLSFARLSVDPADVAGMPAVPLYESPPESAPQPSRYFIAEIDGDIVWIRIADHWGRFRAYRPDLGREMPYHWVLRDVEPETARHAHRTVRVGYVPVSSLAS